MELTLQTIKDALKASRHHSARPEHKAFKAKYKQAPGTFLRFATAHLIELWESGAQNVPERVYWQDESETIEVYMYFIKVPDCSELQKILKGLKHSWMLPFALQDLGILSRFEPVYSKRMTLLAPDCSNVLESDYDELQDMWKIWEKYSHPQKN